MAAGGPHARGGDGGGLGLLSSSERAVMSPLWQYAPLAGLSWQPWLQGAVRSSVPLRRHTVPTL